jgi:hypothetical protein
MVAEILSPLVLANDGGDDDDDSTETKLATRKLL